jgi:A/G-specific adenine glycosylase
VTSTAPAGGRAAAPAGGHAPAPARSAEPDPELLAAVRAGVLAWFEGAGRDLPWRRTRDPWHVLVAEVLAQQTQAERAATAFPVFLASFPDPAALAAASPAEVLRRWQGLGYNRRALALRACAQAVVERGGWPESVAELAALPGVGPYTARAVACFALGQQVAPVDTNVARVLARSLAGTDPSRLGLAARQRLADAALPGGLAWEWSSALMDLGAAHCRPRPRCGGCPIAARCRWLALGAAAPPPSPKRAAPFRSSDRRWRGAVVRVLAASPEGLAEAELAAAVDAASAERPAGWFTALLARLESDGLIARHQGRFHLPPA